jgi:hypothetical protein
MSLEVDKDIFAKASIVHKSMPCWSARKKVNTKDLDETPDVNKEWLTAAKRLFHKDALKPHTNIITAARNFVDRYALPFPWPGLHLVPREYTEIIDDEFQKLRTAYNQATEDFVLIYPEGREAARLQLGRHFKITDYPIDIRSAFGFSWQFLNIDMPNAAGEAHIFDPQLYQREKEKLLATFEQTRQVGIQALRVELFKIIQQMEENFGYNADGKPKIFRNTTITNFYDWLERFKNRDIFEDFDLHNLIETAQNVLQGHDAQDFRDDLTLRAQAQQTMKTVASGISALPTPTGRAIDFDLAANDS